MGMDIYVYMRCYFCGKVVQKDVYTHLIDYDDNNKEHKKLLESLKDYLFESGYSKDDIEEFGVLSCDSCKTAIAFVNISV